MKLSEFFNSQDILELILAVILLAFSYMLGRIVRKLLVRFTSKSTFQTKPFAESFILSIAKSVTLLSITLVFVISKEFFAIPDILEKPLNVISNLMITLTIGNWAYYLAEIPGLWFEKSVGTGAVAGTKMFSPILKRTLQVIVIGLVLAQAYTTISNKKITPIIASLGIAGAVVALAAQDTFKNFFGSFVLAGDKPFEIGERVVVDGFDGPVESIGLRSTRIRTLDGHLITVPNGELANKSIQNIGKRPFIRRVATISITYDTQPDKIEEALQILKDILDNHEGMDSEYPPRVYFKDLATFSFDIIMIYWYHPPEYWAYMEFSQKVNLEIVKRFNAAGIEFAFPTQTIYMDNEAN